MRVLAELLVVILKPIVDVPSGPTPGQGLVSRRTPTSAPRTREARVGHQPPGTHSLIRGTTVFSSLGFGGTLGPRMCIRFDLLDMTLPLKFGIQEAQITADQSLNACHHIIHTAATIQPRCPQPHH